MTGLRVRASAAIIPVAMLGFAGFVLLCTMNAAGYRYGASDQALYTPAILRHVDPALFPRDARLIDTQARLMLNDEAIASIVRVTGVPLPYLFIVLYVLTLALLLTTAVRLGSHFYRTKGAIVAVAAALTLRHSIAKTGTSTLEGYFHPRQLAFALGLLAIVMFLERRDRSAIVLLVAAGVAHTTTFFWFAIWLTVAAWVGRPSSRRNIAIGLVLVAAAAAWAIGRGPLAGRLTPIDAEWMAVIATKDYLFPLGWPWDAWLTNAITIPVILVLWRMRVRAGHTFEGESALVIGALALAAVFVCWLPLDAARLALAVQMQTSRVFWMLDALATFYLVWALAEGGAVQPQRRAAAIAIVLILLSTIRGVYLGFVQFPDRKIFSIDVEHADWREAMAWARTSPRRSGWLADPAHAALYGSSLRAVGERDVLLEDIKDAALAIYDREIAMRIADRRRALAAMHWDTPDGARALARRYDLDYLVTSRPMALPVVYRAGSLTIYDLR
jgi:hypothetical protein